MEGQSGVEVVKARIRIGPDGRIQNADLINSSRKQTLDASIREALTAVSQVEPPPAGYSGDWIDLTINFRYEPL